MNQVIETTDKEKYEMYSLLEKDVLIGMLIEANKHLQRLTPKVFVNSNPCQHYTPGNSSVGICMDCGQSRVFHN